MERGYFEEASGKALVWFCVYGNFPDTPVPDAEAAGDLPAEIECRRFPRDSGAFMGFLHGPIGAWLDEDPGLARKVKAATGMLRVFGELEDRPDLDYLASAIGSVSALAARGAAGILDPQTLTWWTPQGWSAAFDPFRFRAHDHVVILRTVGPAGACWFHTRGMRKFSRPDIGISGVPEGHEGAALEIINRLIEFQAHGGRVPDGQGIRMRNVPPGLVCRQAGSLDDEDFNNFHIAIQWPAIRP